MIGRHWFCMRKQQENETNEEYITSLTVLATKCEFNDMVDIFIRDQFVFYCFSKKIQERLLACRNPTLQEVIDIAKRVEHSLESSKVLSTENEHASTVFSLQDRRKLDSKTGKKLRLGNAGENKFVVCYRCGSKKSQSRLSRMSSKG